MPRLDSNGSTRYSAIVSAGGLLRAGLFHYARLLGNGMRAVREVEAALGATPDESVLDFACGCGWFSRAVPGHYLGIDLDRDYIRFAQWRWGSPRRRFEAMALEALPEDTRFDKSLMASVLHHLSDAEAAAVLGRLARMVRRRLVVLDLDPEASNGVQAFLLAHDRGRHVRPVARQRALLERHFRVVEQRGFPNTPHTVVHVLFACEPR